MFKIVTQTYAAKAFRLELFFLHYNQLRDISSMLKVQISSLEVRLDFSFQIKTHSILRKISVIYNKWHVKYYSRVRGVCVIVMLKRSLSLCI